MVMMVEPLREAIADARAQLPQAEVVYLSPQGERLGQSHLCNWAQSRELVLVCGRYEGIDERVIELDVDREVSLGDFVLSGGEIAALAVIDGVSRLVPGVLGCEHSAEQVVCGQPFGLSALHPAERGRGIEGAEHFVVRSPREYRPMALKQSLGRTSERRPDLLAKRTLGAEEQRLLDEYSANAAEIAELIVGTGGCWH